MIDFLKQYCFSDFDKSFVSFQASFGPVIGGNAGLSESNRVPNTR
jgi:hypothetical protein